MALISCPSCGKTISDKALQCPHCGCAQESSLVNTHILTNQIHLTNWQTTLWILLKISGVLYLFLSIYPLLFTLGISGIIIDEVKYASFWGMEDWNGYITITNVVEGFAMLIAFFSISMVIKNNYMKSILSILWIAMVCYFICSFIGDITINPQIFWSYRGIKLIFLGLLLYKLIKTPLSLPLIFYILISIFYVYNFYYYQIAQHDVCVTMGYIEIIGCNGLGNLILAIFFLTISKSSWRKVFNI